MKELQTLFSQSKINGQPIQIKTGFGYTVEAIYAGLITTVGTIVANISVGQALKALHVASTGPIASWIVPVNAALGPWLAAADIARQSGNIFALHDLAAAAQGKGGKCAQYVCVCGKCGYNIGYIVNKKETNVAKMAVGVATVGAASLVFAPVSIYKWVANTYGTRTDQKLAVSEAIVEAARKNCTLAMATIFVLVSEWDKARPGAAVARALAILLSTDGGESLKKQW